MQILFQTPRLTVRLMERKDAGFILRQFNSPTWLHFIGDRQVSTVQEADNYIEQIYLKSYTENGFGAWVVTLKDSGEPIGTCGLFKRAYLPIPDIGYALLPEFEGKGYAREAAEGALAYTRDVLGKKELMGIVSEINHRSFQLLEKLGFKFQELIQPPGEDRSLKLYHIALGE